LYFDRLVCRKHVAIQQYRIRKHPHLVSRLASSPSIPRAMHEGAFQHQDNFAEEQRPKTPIAAGEAD
jgi:hypothetical protein